MEGDLKIENEGNEESIDMNLTPKIIQEEEEEVNDQSESNIYVGSYKIGDLFILITEGEEFKEDALVTIQEIKKEEKKIYLKDENENDLFLSIDDNNKILLKTNDYHIFEIEKVEEFDLDELDTINLMITKDIFPDIELDIVETKEKKYSYQERKENLITELISLYNAYDNDPLIYEISDISNHFLQMIQNDDNIYDYSDSLSFVKDMIHRKQYNLPTWIIPIVENRKVLYKTEEEGQEEHDDIINKKFTEELKEKYEIFTRYDEFNPNTYQSIILMNDNFRPYQNKNLLSIPYDGLYLRNCHETSPCNGLLNQFIIDSNKTKKPLEIPVFKDKKTTFQTLTSQERLSIVGFYTLPHTLLNITLTEKNDLPLYELYLLSDKKYSYIPFSHLFRKSRIVPHIVSNDSIKLDENWTDSIHSYLFNEGISIDNMGEVLQNNFPDYNDIISVIPNKVKQNILNYNDFKKVFISYNMDYHSLDEENRMNVNKLIQKNIRNKIREYNRLVKRTKIIPKEKKVKLLSTNEKIKLSKDYIFSLYIIPVRNFYINRFIQTFARKAEINEDQNFLYDKESDNQLLCKHYLFSSKVHKDKDTFITMKSIFGKEPKDGIISCKICGEYLCSEDFSDLEGFSEGKPTSTREVLESDEVINALSEKQIDIKKRIQKISGILGISLTNYDKQKIIDFYETIDNTSIVDHRYQKTNAFNKHPTMMEIKEKYKPIKPAKTKEDKKKNKISSEKLKTEGSLFKEYLIDCNELLITSFLILFFLQTSIPPYQLNTTINLNLWESFTHESSWERIKHNIHNEISMNTIDLLFQLLQRIVEMNSKDSFWKNINTFLKESIVDETLFSFNEHFIMISSYILRNSSITQKLKDYFNIKNNVKQTIYLNEFWPSYKPLYDNQLVLKMNEKINKEPKQYLLRNGSSINFENISSIQSFEYAYTTPRYESLEIPFSTIIKNESYERLFNYSVHLHGISEENPLINLLIQQFLNTISDSETIQQIIETIGWDSFTNELKVIKYQDLKEVFIIKLTEYFKNKNPDDKDTIDTYIHIRFNNWNGMLLNGHPKRNYNYIQPVIFPNESPEELLDTDMINKLFDKFCFDENDTIYEKYDNDQFIFNLVADPTIEREAVCSNKISQTSENLNRILDYKRSLCKLPLRDITNTQTTDRLHQFIETNNLLQYDADEAHEILYSLHNIEQSQDKEKEYSRIFNEVIQYNNEAIQRIQRFFTTLHEEGHLIEEQVRRFKTNFGRNIDSLEILLNKFLEGNKVLHNSFQNIFYIIGRLSKQSDKTTRPIGTIFHPSIPDQWKLSESNHEYMKDFLNSNEFLLHNDIFIPEKNIRYQGFMKYHKEHKYSLCFQGLFNHIQAYYHSDIHSILGNEKTIFKENYAELFNQFMFLFLFSKIIDYIDNLNDEQSPSSTFANELFLSLEEQDSMDLNDSIKICSEFSFDILVHFLEEYFDPSWIHQNDLLSDKLSKQKEREKQKLIDDLESKTGDARLVTLEQQRAGITNWHRDAGIGNLEYLMSDTRVTQLENERADQIKELVFQNQEQLEVLEGNNINTDLFTTPQGIPEEEEMDQEGYTQRDIDREDEGLDGADEDGDYREN